MPAAALHRTARPAIEFDRFFREHYRRLIACGLAFTGDRERAVDAAQEALTRAFQSWTDVQHVQYPAAWLRRVLLNILVDEGRRDQRHAAAADRLAPIGTASMDDNGPLLAAIRQLPERQRTAVVLHYLDDLPIKEVALAMNIADGTVKATLHSARAALNEKLRDDR